MHPRSRQPPLRRGPGGDPVPRRRAPVLRRPTPREAQPAAAAAAEAGDRRFESRSSAYITESAKR